MTRIPIVYISGKFRHYLPDGSFDLPKMEAEKQDELRWGRLIIEAGCVPFAPIRSTDYLEGIIPDDDFITCDIEVIVRLRADYDMILMRRSWKTSKGSNKELAAAQDRGLEVLYGIQGAEVIAEYLSAKAEGREPEMAIAE